jgi:nucleoside 2-deoxyribosyltransferase
MATLEDQIASVEKLDKLRQRAQVLQQEAIEALTAAAYSPQPRDGSKRARWKKRRRLRENWSRPGDDIEKVEILRALNTLKPKEKMNKKIWDDTHKAVLKELDLTYDECKAGPDDGALDNVPIFRCSLILRALAETPGRALSPSALFCLYWIVRELNQIAGPAWVSGAARAASKALPTAFITAECAHALLALTGALERTAQAATLLGEEANRQLKFISQFAIWNEQEKAFREEALRVSLGVLKPSLIVELPAGTAQQHLDAIKDALREDPGPLRKADSLNLERSTIIGGGRSGPASSLFEDNAKDIAYQAVADLLDAVRISDAYLDPVPAPDKLAEKIAEKLRNGRHVIRNILAPMEHFALSVIDEQLAAESAPLGLRVDAAELVFAAELLGLVTDWSKPKVKAAYEVIRPLLSVNGRLLSLRPFDVTEKGYRLNVQTIEVTRRLADLVANIDAQPGPDFVERLMRPFEDTRVPAPKKTESGWTIDPPPREHQSLWWMTALVVDALGSVIRMLDQSINRQVLGNFYWRKPSELKLGLDELFYPDYGLVAANIEQESIAVKLQRLRAHIGDTESQKKLFSLILYGPPGTGKTTLVEAVAKSAGVPMVEVTPSDILMGGEAEIERRARVVFVALSKLTNAVILFDEFDPILQDRAKRKADEPAKSIFEFLTPGMLPKLKALNEAAKKQRLSYVLATNFIYDLDPAVTRKGRFDGHHGIYPPDAISRRGRLLDQLNRLEPDLNSVLPDRERRILDVLGATAGGPMDQLGRKGWFTAPDDEDDFGGSPFGYIIKGNPAQPPSAPPEADYSRERGKYIKARAESRKTGEPVSTLEKRYWDDWRRIVRWDKASPAHNAAWENLHKTKGGLQVYLAGPDVFVRNAEEVGKAKQELCARCGFIGMFPLDNELDLKGLSNHQKALKISAANESMIRECDLVIANVTPFRGPSADPGTAYEMGFARSLGLPVFAYTNVAGTLLKRIEQEFGGEIPKRDSGEFEDSFQMLIENYECVDNLMLVGAVESAGSPIEVSSAAEERRFTDLKGFEQCLRVAAKRLGVEPP